MRTRSDPTSIDPFPTASAMHIYGGSGLDIRGLIVITAVVIIVDVAYDGFPSASLGRLQWPGPRPPTRARRSSNNALLFRKQI